MQVFREDAVLRKTLRRTEEDPPGTPRYVGFLYVAPALIVYGLFAIAPIVHTVYLSFFTWSGANPPPTWVGVRNYSALLRDTAIVEAFGHSLELIVFYSVFPILIGLCVAGIAARTAVRGMALFRTVLFLPQVVATASIAVIWRWIYSYDGPLNVSLRAVGLGKIAKTWLGNFTWALPAIGGVGTWFEFGLCMVLFIAGAQKIPASLYDAARVDGASAFREFLVVTLPGLRSELVVAGFITVIAALRSFDLVYITTTGGPGTATTVPALQIYNDAFRYGEVGTAAATATVLAIMIGLVALAVLWIGGKVRSD